MQDLNIFEENSPVDKMEVSTVTGLPQFKANVLIEYDATAKTITVTPTGLSANAATMYDLIVAGPQGKSKRVKVNLATPAAATADLGAAGFDLTKTIRWTFLATKEGSTQLLSITRTISATQDYSQSFSNL